MIHPGSGSLLPIINGRFVIEEYLSSLSHTIDHVKDDLLLLIQIFQWPFHHLLGEESEATLSEAYSHCSVEVA